MDSCYAPMVLRRLDGVGTVRCNGPFAQLTGYSDGELALNPLVEWIHPDDWQQLEDAIERRDEAPTIARHRAADGTWVSLQWRIRQHEGHGVILGTRPSLSAPLMEPSPRIPAETANSGIAETLAAMAQIVESKNPGMLCSIVLVDETGERITVGAGPSLPAEYNRAVEGLRIGPMVGSCGTAAFWNEPVVVADIQNDPLWTELRAAASIAGVSACWSHPVADSDGRVLGAMALYSRVPAEPRRQQMDGLEIAARMVGLAVERDLLQQRVLRTEKIEALGLLAGGIAHDFNNLLSTIVGNAELLLTRPNDRGQPELEDIHKAGTAAAELCAQILAYTGRGNTAPRTVACNEIVNEVASLLRVGIPKNIELHFDLHRGDCGVSGDAAQIRSLVMNLLTNAVDAIGDVAGEITIRTSIRDLDDQGLSEWQAEGAPLAPGSYVVLTVADTGVGIDTRDRARMFDPFFSTKSDNRGLGLAAVHGIVTSHHGGLLVESQVGHGTTFTVLLPHTTSAPTPEPCGTPHPAESLDATVLVADDDDAVLRVMVRVLSTAGCEVLSAADGEEAIELFRQHHDAIDCVLLDYSMPGKNGAETLVAIRQHCETVPVILASGYAETDLLDRYRDSGLAAVLQKPATRSTIVEAVRSALQTSPRNR